MYRLRPRLARRGQPAQEALGDHLRRVVLHAVPAVDELDGHAVAQPRQRLRAVDGACRAAHAVVPALRHEQRPAEAVRRAEHLVERPLRGQLLAGADDVGCAGAGGALRDGELELGTRVLGAVGVDLVRVRVRVRVRIRVKG